MQENKATASSSFSPQAEKPAWYVRGWWPWLLIATTCLLLYAVTLGYGFSPLDEYWIITKEKDTLSHFSNIPHLFGNDATLGMYYRPMLSLSLMVDMVAGGGDRFCFHLSNILLHTICMLLLFRFLVLLPLDRTFAFFATLIFAVHPANLHAVAWVPGRNDTLLASFVLLSCIFLLGFLREGKWYQLLFHFLFFFLALFTKESAILLPLIYAFFYWFYGRKKSLAGFIPYVVVWVASGAGLYMIRNAIVHFMPPVQDADFGKRIVDFFSTLFIYTGKVVLPVQQSVMPLLQDTDVWPFLLVVVVVLLLLLRFGLRDRKVAVLGLAWFGILIAIPVWLGMANGIGECYEHRAYTPMIGAVLLFSQLKLPVSPRIARGVALLVIGLFALKTALRLPVYSDEYHYVEAGTKEAPDVGLFHDLLGSKYQEQNRFPEALAEHQRAIALDSGNADYFSHRGFVYGVLGDYSHALADDERAIRMDRSLLQVFFNRSSAHFGLKHYAQARADLDSAKWFGVKIPAGYEDSLNRALEPGALRK